MMNDVAVITGLTGTAIVILAAVYLYSKDPSRRRRAWSLLKLLLSK